MFSNCGIVGRSGLPTAVRLALVRAVANLWLVAATVVPSLSLAATQVSGAVVVDTVWTAANSPYLVTGSITVGNGATLSIDAGVIVHMSAGADLTVDSGGLRVKGTVSEPVRITSHRLLGAQAGIPGDWGRLRFNGGTIAAKAILENLVVEFGQGVVLSAAAPTFNNVALNHHNAPAMTIDLASSPAGTGNSAQGNAINGIVVPAGELRTNVTWALRGIPFVLAQGTVSVGQAPALLSATPASLEQGEQASLSVSGTRLRGLEQLRFEPPIPGASVFPGATDTSAVIGLGVPAAMPVGPVTLSAVTDAGEVTLANAFRITALEPPSVVGVAPRTIARNAETPVLLSGNFLNAVTVATSVPGLEILGVNAARTSLSFRVKVAPLAAMAIHPFTLTNAAGQTTFSLEVIPEVAPPPPFAVIPPIVALAPDSVYRNVLFSAAQSVATDRNYTLTVVDATVARLRSASVVLPADQVSVPIAIAGLKVGTTVLRIAGDGLATPLEVPVNVVASSIQQASIAATVGVVRGEQFSGGGSNRTVLSPQVGLLVGNGNTSNSANYHVVAQPAGLVRGNMWGGTSFAVSPAVGLIRQ